VPATLCEMRDAKILEQVEVLNGGTKRFHCCVGLKLKPPYNLHSRI